MAFTNVTVEFTVEVVPGNPAGDTVVNFRLSGPISDGVVDLIPETITVAASAEGTGSTVLPANDDESTTPTGSSYLVTVVTAGNVVDAWSVVIPHADPTVELLSLARLPA